MYGKCKKLQQEPNLVLFWLEYSFKHGSVRRLSPSPGLVCFNFCHTIIETIEIKSSHYLFILPGEWCHDDTETSAFNVNIRLLTIIETINNIE